MTAPREWILCQHLRCQCRESVRTLAEINRPRGQQYTCTSGNVDHGRDAEARTARNTAVNVVSSMPDATRTTAPASVTSMARAAEALRWRRLSDYRNKAHGRRGRCLAR